MVKYDGVKSELGFSFRSRIDIIASILREAIWSAKKTRIMYRCNLNFRQLQTYLDLLLNTGLLKTIPEEEKSTKEIFQTTIKGRMFLKTYHNLVTLLGA